MKQKLLPLFAITMLLSACVSQKERFIEAIEWHYSESSTVPGGGSSKPSDITILKIKKERVLAVVTGTKSNYSLPVPEEPNAFADTLWFRYKRTKNGYSVTGIQGYKNQ
jgi:hypothetical protein